MTIAAIWTFMKSGMGQALMAAIALILVVGWIWNSGRNYEADQNDARNSKATTEAYQDRATIEQQNRNANGGELCTLLGGNWKNNTCE